MTCRYGSDITVTLPANGKFSDKQRGIYEVHTGCSICILNICVFTKHSLHGSLLQGLQHEIVGYYQV